MQRGLQRLQLKGQEERAFQGETKAHNLCQTSCPCCKASSTRTVKEEEVITKKNKKKLGKAVCFSMIHVFL